MRKNRLGSFSPKKIRAWLKGGPPSVPVFLVGVIVICAVFCPWLAPLDPTMSDLSNVIGPPAWQEGGNMTNLLGTDHMGRDIFSRLIWGARISVIVAVTAIALGTATGTILGLTAAFFGGWVDAVLMRIVDIFLAMPYILIAIVLVAAMGPSLMNVIIVLALVTWARYCRMIRGEALSIREKDFVAMAIISGCSPIRIMVKHIFPNVTNTLIILATLNVGVVILLEAVLSFLGIGIPSPTPCWGRMVADGRSYIATAWWVAAFPGLAIMALVLSCNLIGDWLRDTLDPKRRVL